MDHEPGAYGILAEILVSKRVALTHVRLVGELIVAQALLDEGPHESHPKLSATEWADLTERALDSEDGYKEAWRELRQNSDPSSAEARLQSLEASLRETILTFRSLREELDLRHGA